MFAHLPHMIAALSLTLTAGSLPNWPRLPSAFEHRCPASHDHDLTTTGTSGWKASASERRLHDVRVLSFGP